MFWRMVFQSFWRQKGKMAMIAFTIALGASLSTAMLNVMFGVGDKINKELKTYGANIRVVPQTASLLSDMYGLENGNEQFLREDELGKIKTIFWAFNIENYAPYLESEVLLTEHNGDKIFGGQNEIASGGTGTAAYENKTGEKIGITGSWFSHHLSLPTGEELDTGMNNMKNWWHISGNVFGSAKNNSGNVANVSVSAGNVSENAANAGAGSGNVSENGWLLDSDENYVMVGSELSRRFGIGPGDTIKLSGSESEKEFTVKSVFNSGDNNEDSRIFMNLHDAQELDGKNGLINSIEVTALTTPDNELARRAAQNPESLTNAEREIWYCTAYVSSICYQIQEVITNAVAKPVRQVAESEGAILNKTQLLMLLITVLSLVGSALGISNLVTASVMERSREIGLLKAVGAHDSPVAWLVLTEIIITAVIGGTAGYFAGIGFAEIIGKSVFGSAIAITPTVIPLVAILILIVTLAGSLPSIRMILRLEPAEVLHGR